MITLAFWLAQARYPADHPPSQGAGRWPENTAVFYALITPRRRAREWLGNTGLRLRALANERAEGQIIELLLLV